MDESRVGISLGAWILAALGGAFTVGASWLVIAAGRRDRAQNQEEENFKQLSAHVAEHEADIAHITGYLQGKDVDYEPRQR